MKGQNPIISHTFVIAVSVLFIFFIIISLNMINKDHEKFIIFHESKEICYYLSNAVYSMYENDYNGSYVISEKTVHLPNRMSIYGYRVAFNGSTIFINSTMGTVNCTVPLNITMSGNVYGGQHVIQMVRTPSGTEVTIN